MFSIVKTWLQKTGVVVPESSLIVKSNDDLFWTSQATSLGPTTTDQDIPASPHSDGVFPHSNTDAIDEILGDLHEETAPRAEMEDLSPVKLMDDKASPNRFTSSVDSQFNFDGLSESQKSTTVEVVKPGNESVNEVEASSVDIVVFSDNLNDTSSEMEDAMKSEIHNDQREEFEVQFEASNSDKPSSQVNTGDFNTQGNLDINIAAASDPFLAGNSVPEVSFLGTVNALENFDFDSDVVSNPFLAGNSVPTEGSLGDFNAKENFEFNAGPASNPFVAGNFVPREDSLDDSNVQENFEFNTGAASDPFLSGNSVPREGSPSVKNDVEEREILRQLVEEVRIEERASVLDQNISKGATMNLDAVSLVSDSKASANTYSYEPEVDDFRPKEREQKAAAVPETVYNKMYNVSNGDCTSPYTGFQLALALLTRICFSCLFTASLCMKTSNLLDIVFDFLFWSPGVDLCCSLPHFANPGSSSYVFRYKISYLDCKSYSYFIFFVRVSV